MKRLLLAAIFAVAIIATTAADTGKAIIVLPMQRTTLIGATYDLWTWHPSPKRCNWLTIRAEGFTAEDMTTQRAATGGEFGVRADLFNAWVFAGVIGYTEPNETMVWGKFAVTIGARF